MLEMIKQQVAIHKLVSRNFDQEQKAVSELSLVPAPSSSNTVGFNQGVVKLESP